jgi:hypothetical protein
MLGSLGIGCDAMDPKDLLDSVVAHASWMISSNSLYYPLKIYRTAIIYYLSTIRPHFLTPTPNKINTLQWFRCSLPPTLSLAHTAYITPSIISR